MLKIYHFFKKANQYFVTDCRKKGVWAEKETKADKICFYHRNVPLFFNCICRRTPVNPVPGTICRASFSEQAGRICTPADSVFTKPDAQNERVFIRKPPK